GGGSAGPGLGLGLATVRRLIEGHGGRYGVDSREGAGALFWFELPGDRLYALSDTDERPTPVARRSPGATDPSGPHAVSYASVGSRFASSRRRAPSVYESVSVSEVVFVFVFEGGERGRERGRGRGRLG